jgi:hypothetical protein
VAVAVTVAAAVTPRRHVRLPAIGLIGHVAFGFRRSLLDRGGSRCGALARFVGVRIVSAPGVTVASTRTPAVVMTVILLVVFIGDGVS